MRKERGFSQPERDGDKKKHVQGIDSVQEVSVGLPVESSKEQEQYQEIFQGDVWELRDASGAFIEAYAIDTIHRHGGGLQVVAKSLGPDLLVRAGTAIAEKIMEGRTDERSIEAVRKELRDDGYRRVKQGGVSERTFAVERKKAASVLLPKKVGEVTTLFRRTQFFDDKEIENGKEQLVVERVESPATPLYVFLDSSLSSAEQDKLAKRYYTAKDIEKKIREEGWALNGEKMSTVEAIPEIFTKVLDAKKKEKRFWTRESLLSEVLPGETCVIRNTQFGGGERLYRRMGDDLISLLNGKAETDNVAVRLNHGWELVEKPEDDFMAGREMRQFLSSGETPETETQHTVTKKTDGYYVAIGDDWQGPLTKVDMLERIRAEHWEPIVEINSLEDFLRDGGPEATLKVRAFEEIFIDEWQEFQKTLANMSQNATPRQVTELKKTWGTVLVPHIESMMREDLAEHDHLSEEQAQRVVADLSAKVSLLKK